MLVRTHTALHVLKGAVQKVLGARWTAGVSVEDGKGRLVVQFHRKPTDDEVTLIEEEANQKISDDQGIEELEIDRSEAEARWGDRIYDLFPLPRELTRLRIVNIANWNVNACKERHCSRTGEIGGIRIQKVRFRDAKKLLEISFVIEQKAGDDSYSVKA
jgi:alanyl-tRNA synthetase